MRSQMLINAKIIHVKIDSTFLQLVPAGVLGLSDDLSSSISLWYFTCKSCCRATVRCWEYWELQLTTFKRLSHWTMLDFEWPFWWCFGISTNHLSIIILLFWLATYLRNSFKKQNYNYCRSFPIPYKTGNSSNTKIRATTQFINHITRNRDQNMLS